MKQRNKIPYLRNASVTRLGGFTLVELMIAMALGLVLVGGLLVMFTNANISFQNLSKVSRQLENGRYAVQVLSEDIMHAGFYGQFASTVTPTALHDPCSTVLADLQNGLQQLPIQAYEGAAADPTGGCLANYQANTDVLVVRRASSNAILDGEALGSATQHYLQSRSTGFVLNTGADATVFSLTEKDGTTRAAIRPYVVHIYYIRSCNDCAGGGDGIPTLVRSELVGGNFVDVAIAEGIQNVKYTFGVDTDGDGEPNQYSAAAAVATADWGNVVTTEVSLLARTVESVGGYTDTRTYTVGDTAVPAFNDSFKRQVFSTVSRLENISGRRELE